mmetsp:Transcript_35467/g.88486  ORF Transcript_35467/g.88486 Transcript_35467/m.88486 type:complete len:332 (+) Transcript_35467:341-1336(+)
MFWCTYRFESGHTALSAITSISMPCGASRFENSSRAFGNSEMFLIAAITERSVKASVSTSMRMSQSGSTQDSAALNFPAFATVIAIMQPTARRVTSGSRGSPLYGVHKKASVFRRSALIACALPSGVFEMLNVHWRAERRSFWLPRECPCSMHLCSFATAPASSATRTPISNRVRFASAESAATVVTCSPSSRAITSACTMASAASSEQPSRELEIECSAAAADVRTPGEASLRAAVIDGTRPWLAIAMRPWMTIARLARQSADRRLTGSVSDWISCARRSGIDGVALTAEHFSSCDASALLSEYSVWIRSSSVRLLSHSSSASLGIARCP